MAHDEVKQIISYHCLDNTQNLYILTTDRKKLIVKSNSPWARMAAFKMKTTGVAMVIGRTIHVHGVDPLSLLGNEKWLIHELVHVKQFEKYGFLSFVCLYLWEWIKHGYRENRYEQEARQAEEQMDSVSIFDEYDFELK